jgi:3-methyladenine DNA glycosylase AlkD
MKKERGHYCHVCGRRRANEKFSGKDHARHICKDCAKEQRATARAKHKAFMASLSLPAAKLLQEFKSRQNPAQAAHLMRFFKTGPGQYGEGDRFLGLKVPITRALSKPYRGRLSLADYAIFLASEWHEVRLGALLLMGDQADALSKTGDAGRLHKLAAFYDQHLERANNWDLVDLSVCEILGPYWATAKPSNREIRDFLMTWADSGNLWRERAAMVATHSMQRMGSLDETFWLVERFISHSHDLMHKACGWMLREAGKRDVEALRAFLAKFHQQLPRTALRYAIEHMDSDERKKWMAK